MSGTLTSFTPGDIVVSISGDGDGSNTYEDGQASPLVLEELTAAGQALGDLVLPQTTTNVNGKIEYAVSAEYGSSSEGSLELSGDGHSLVIMGYAVNAQTYNAGGAAEFGNASLAQSTSVQNEQYATVARVVADISANGVVDSSTALLNVFNTNNPRSVATVNGSTFYISGQGVKGDATQGLFSVQDGASTATAIDTADDTRTVEIFNGQLYVSQDSKQPTNGGTSNIAAVGTGLPTGSAGETVLPGISQTVTLDGVNGNSINGGTGTVHLSPENFFFANATTLYVADGGDPKQGGLGDGGLQKWSLVGGTWRLDYTLTAGLPLVPDTASSGTTGLIGLTGSVSGNSIVTLYATNSTLGDLDQTYVFSINDQLSATTLPATESFTTIFTAAPDTNVRGIAFAPTPACYAAGTRIAVPGGCLAVEALAAGDLVLTASGAARPVRWVGRRSYAGRFLKANPQVQPVQFSAGSLGGCLPERDLYVSPEHAMFLDGVLVPAHCLVNGVTIVRARGMERVDYFHVELDTHDLLLAEGAPSESFIDDGSRGVFHNAAEFAGLYPDAEEAGGFCAPRVDNGAALERIRVRLRPAVAAA